MWQKGLKTNQSKNTTSIMEFFDFFKWYLWILIIGILLGNWIYIVVRESLEDMTQESRSAILEQNSRMLDMKLSTINELIYIYENTSTIMDYAAEPDFNNAASISKAIKVRTELNKRGFYILEDNESIILDNMIYYENSHMMITKDTLEKPKKLLEEYIIYPSDVMEQVMTFVTSENSMRKYFEATTIDYYGEPKDVMTYIHQMQSKKGQRVYAMLLIDVEEIYDSIKDTLSEGSYYTVYFGQEPVMSVKKDTDEPKGYALVKEEEYRNAKQSSDYLQINKHQDYSMVHHEIFEPMCMIEESLKHINKIFILTLSLYLLMGGGVALVFTGQNYKQIKELFKGLKGGSVRSLKEGTRQMIQKNNELRLQNEMRLYTIKNNIYKTILNGQLSDEEEIKRQFESIDENFVEEETALFQVVYILGEDYRDQIHEYIITSDLSSYVQHIEKIEWGRRNIYILRYEDADHQTAVVESLQEIERQMNQTEQAIIVGVGNLYERVEKIHRSYSEAKCVAQVRMGHEDYPQLYADLITKEQELYYPEELENKLINTILTGDQEIVEEMLKSINDENVNKRRLLGYTLKCLKCQQIGTLSKTMIKVNKLDESLKQQINKRIKYMLHSLNHNEYIDIREDMEDCLRECYLTLCEHVERGKQEKVDQTKDDIMKYINENITDSELCMNKITDVFDVSRGYLSKVIKEATNKNFSTYVEEYRMELANNMIKSTQLPIYVIAEKVGYYSSGTFCRAYKRKYGISPNQLREEVS